MSFGEQVARFGVYPPSKLSGASLGGGFRGRQTPLFQPRSFRDSWPVAADLQDGGGAGDLPGGFGRWREAAGQGEALRAAGLQARTVLGPLGPRGRLGRLVSALEERREKASGVAKL